MAPLPTDRVQPSYPFHTTGVDYCGPIKMKASKIRNAKFIDVYIAIFVCFTTKAVHIEIVTSRETECYLQALSRFIDRRLIKPATIWSDNASEFKKGAKDIKELMQNINRNLPEIQNFLLQQNIDFKNIPPRSPEHGGLWEAAVKSFKKIFYKLMNNSHLTYEELSTVCCKCEAILNSRPLTPLSDDPNDPQVITPAHILTGQQSTSMPEADVNEDVPISNLQRYDRVIAYQKQFWKRWSKEYLRNLQLRSKNYFNKPNLKEGQLVLLHEDNTPSRFWPLAIIEKIHPDDKGNVRVVTLKTSKRSSFQRPITKISPLPIEDTNQ
jgi:hypothetical protein